MFKRPPKKESEEIKITPKCDFCKTNESIGKVDGINYCSNEICIKKWWKRREIIADERNKASNKLEY